MRPLADYTRALLKTRLTPYLCYKVKEEEAAAPVDIERESTGPATVLSFWGFVGRSSSAARSGSDRLMTGESSFKRGGPSIEIHPRHSSSPDGDGFIVKAFPNPDRKGPRPRPHTYTQTAFFEICSDA